MPFLHATLTKEEAEILRMLIFKPSSRTRYTTRPYNYTTSFHLVDKFGRTLMHKYFSRKHGRYITKPKTVKLRINHDIWMQYRENNRSVGLPRTDCSILREFYREFQVFNNEKPTQETLRYFVETLVKLNPNVTSLRFEELANPTVLQQKSFIDNRKIVIFPVQRKKPSYRCLNQ